MTKEDALDQLEEYVTDMQEEGNSDLRTIIFVIGQLRRGRSIIEEEGED